MFRHFVAEQFEPHQTLPPVFLAINQGRLADKIPFFGFQGHGEADPSLERVYGAVKLGVALLLCDFFQTFPSFIYLIPVILLFGITDTSVIIAAITYATVPATRFTIEGLRSIPPVLQDAGSMSGVSRMQRLVSIELPLAFPYIMLGLNQMVIFALFMVIIGAFIGTTDLGQLILKAISDRQGTGIGIVLGLCVAFIGLTADQIIRTWANNKKKMLGLT